MADNDARIHVDVTGEQTAARKLEHVGDAAADAGKQVEGLGQSSTEAAEATEKAGKKFEATGTEAEQLAKKIDLAKKAQQDLVREFLKTGDADTEKEAKQAGREVAKLQRFVKILLSDDDAASAGESLVDGVKTALSSAGQAAGESLIEGVKSTFSELSEYTTPALVGLGVLAAPGLASAISGAVVGGVGLGGIVGGVTLAAHDQRVKDGAADMAATFAAEFGDLGTPFIEPVLEAERKLGSAGSRWADKLAPGMEMLASKVGPLEQGIESLVDEALPGFNRAIEASGPVLDMLADELPNIGASIGSLFDDLAKNPEATQRALEGLLVLTEDLIEETGDFIATLTDAYDALLDIGDALGVGESSAIGWWKETDRATDSNRHFAQSTEESTDAVWDYKAAIDALYDRVRDTQEANIAYEQSIDDLTKALTDGKRTLDIHTQAGRDNWEAINNTADAIKDLRQANLDNNMPLEQANRLYEQQFEALRRTLLNLGYNKKAVDDYINSLRSIPGKISTSFSMAGIETAASAAERLERSLRNARGIAPTSAWGGGFQARAGGGPVDAGVPYIVGEHGPELVVPRGNGTVMTAAQTQAMLSGRSGGASAAGGGFSGRLSVNDPGTALGREMAAWIVPHLQVEIMNQGGDVIAVLGAPSL